MVDGTNAAAFWTATDADALGHITNETFGNRLETITSYSSTTGNLTSITTSGQVQNASYDYYTGHLLKSRTDHIHGLTENFDYDNLNRLKDSTGSTTKNYTYYPNGNIDNKSDVGAYLYGSGTTSSGALIQPHAVTSVMSDGNLKASYHYDFNGNMINGGGRTLEYYSNNKPKKITQEASTICYSYGPADERLTEYDGTLGRAQFKVMVGGLYEHIENFNTPLAWAGPIASTVERYYVTGGNGTVAVFTRSTDTTNASNPIASTTTRYLHGDRLGSIEAITDELGQVVERFSYDAFGAKRDVNNWGDLAPPTSTDSPAVSSITSAGFTGHEELDGVGLIHMGGRVYDPVLGRFLSADPIVQAPDNTQSYNRYTYCLNNPLNLTDPSGYSWLSKPFKSITHGAGGYIFGGVLGFKGVQKWVKQNWRIIAVVAVTIVVAVAMPYILPVVLPILGIAEGTVGAAMVAGAIGGAIIGASNAAIYGEPPLKILESALIGGITGALTGFIGHGMGFGNGPNIEKSLLHGVVQGASSRVMGGSFESGFIGGAISSFGGGIFGDAGLVSWEGRALRVVAMGAVGGTAAQLSGGSFANGAVSAAFVQLFNDINTPANKGSSNNKSNNLIPPGTVVSLIPFVGTFYNMCVSPNGSDLSYYDTTLHLDDPPEYQSVLAQQRISLQEAGYITNYWAPTVIHEIIDGFAAVFTGAVGSFPLTFAFAVDGIADLSTGFYKHGRIVSAASTARASITKNKEY